jgi:hypothetical protein
VVNRNALVPAVALLALLAAGCSSGTGDKPSALPTLSSAAPTATPAPIPSAAQAPTAQGADAFVRFYFQQLNVAFSTADSGIIRAFSDPSCGTCKNYIEALDATPETVIRGESFHVLDVAVPPIEKVGTVVDVYITQPARMLVDRAGKVITKYPAKGQQHLLVNVIRSVGGWRVRGIKSGEPQ